MMVQDQSRLQEITTFRGNMTLEKKRTLRRVEFICTDDKRNPVAHLEYEAQVLEDGKEIANTIHRENISCVEALSLLQEMETYKYPEVS